MYASVHSGGRGLRRFEAIGVAASAGGIKALVELLSELPAEFPCPIVIAQHLSASNQYKSVLPAVLGRRCRLPVRWARTADFLKSGEVLVAPQDYNVEVAAYGGVRLRRAMKRPAPVADVLFASMAKNYPRTGIAVVLSGALRDGARGASLVASAGGPVFAQDRGTATVSDMPDAVISAGAVDFEFSPRMIARALIALTMAPGAAEWFCVRRPSVVNWETAA